MTMPQVSDALSDAIGLQRRIRPTFGYYRKANGEIGIATITELERIAHMKEGWQFLEQYGTFDMTAYTTSHPFEGLFMFGGAHEMPAEQVLKMGLYLDPPLVPTCKQHLTQYHRAHTQACWRGAQRVVFPQMANISLERLGPFACEFCERKLPTRAALQQHQKVAHAQERNNTQLGKTLGTSFSEALNGAAKSPAQADPEKEALRQRVAELEAQWAKREKAKARMANARAAKKPRKETVTSPA